MTAETSGSEFGASAPDGDLRACESVLAEAGRAPAAERVRDG